MLAKLDPNTIPYPKVKRTFVNRFFFQVTILLISKLVHLLVLNYKFLCPLTSP